MENYFNCVICNKEYEANMSKNPFPYPDWIWKDCMMDFTSSDCKCCVGCYFTYVVPMINSDNERYKREIRKNKLRIIKGR